MNPSFSKRLTQSYSLLRDYLKKNQIEAYRLLNPSAEGLDLAVDIYKNDAVIHLFDLVPRQDRGELENALKNVFKINGIYYKDRSQLNYSLPQGPKKEMVIEEYGNRFLINLSDYLDTGLFLDHRETRKWLKAQCKNKIVLNMFAYTGSFTVYASQGGATQTYSVDLSKTYCAWLKKNLELNQMNPENHWVYNMDVFEFFNYAAKKKLVFDVIIIDPPTFSRDGGTTFSVQQNHPRLINEALGILSKEGFILFSTNFQEFRLERKNLEPCRIDEKRNTIPPDFQGTTPHRCFVIKNQSKTGN